MEDEPANDLKHALQRAARKTQPEFSAELHNRVMERVKSATPAVELPPRLWPVGIPGGYVAAALVLIAAGLSMLWLLSPRPSPAHPETVRNSINVPPRISSRSSEAIVMALEAAVFVQRHCSVGSLNAVVEEQTELLKQRTLANFSPGAAPQLSLPADDDSSGLLRFARNQISRQISGIGKQCAVSIHCNTSAPFIRIEVE